MLFRSFCSPTLPSESITAMTLAMMLEDDNIYRDSIVSSLERMDYTKALMVCGEAILQTLRRETDLSVGELKSRMVTCNRLEKLEKTISALAREARAAARERKALLRANHAKPTWTFVDGPGSPQWVDPTA